MNHKLSYRKAKIDDLIQIIELISSDNLGKTRESNHLEAYKKYEEAFNKIDKDLNHYLMVAENEQNKIIGTCHLTIIPRLSFIGTTRMQIESVHVAEKCREQGIGTWMMNKAIEFAKQNNIGIIELTTNKIRTRAKNFYEKLGFKASHEGMKMYIN